MKKTFLFLTTLASFMTACGANQESDLQALTVENGIESLQFQRTDGKIFLSNDGKALAWNHEAPSYSGNKISFKGKIIGDLETGYFCNGPFDSICDARIYKSKASEIQIKDSTGMSQKAINSNTIINVNTASIRNIQVQAAVSGIAKGTCQVPSGAGLKTLPITVEQKNAVAANGAVVKLLEIKTPIFQHNAATNSLEYTKMISLAKVFNNGTIENVSGSSNSQGLELLNTLKLTSVIVDGNTPKSFPTCGNVYFGDLFNCGGFTCAKSDSSYKTQCLVQAGSTRGDKQTGNDQGVNAGKSGYPLCGAIFYGDLFNCGGYTCGKSDSNYKNICEVTTQSKRG